MCSFFDPFSGLNFQACSTSDSLFGITSILEFDKSNLRERERERHTHSDNGQTKEEYEAAKITTQASLVGAIHRYHTRLSFFLRLPYHHNVVVQYPHLFFSSSNQIKSPTALFLNLPCFILLGFFALPLLCSTTVFHKQAENCTEKVHSTKFLVLGLFLFTFLSPLYILQRERERENRDSAISCDRPVLWEWSRVGGGVAVWCAVCICDDYSTIKLWFILVF